MCDCGDGPEAFWERTVKAKKLHTCSECHGRIEAGERYTSIRGIWDGQPSNFKWCADCQELVDWAVDQSSEICFQYGRVAQCIVDDAYESGDTAYLRAVEDKLKAIKTKRSAQAEA